MPAFLRTGFGTTVAATPLTPAQVLESRAAVVPNLPYGGWSPGYVPPTTAAPTSGFEGSYLPTQGFVPANPFTEGPLSDPLSKPGGPTNSPSTPTTTVGDIARQGCDWLPEGWQKTLCRGVVTTAEKVIPGGRTGNEGVTPLANRPACPAGYHETGNPAQPCAINGVGTYIPGDVGRPDYVWTPQYGRFGAGVTPIAVQYAKRVCPAGMVLGKDGLCYDRLARTNRAHNPGARPLLTGGDMNALRRAKGLQKKIRKLNTAHGPKKACSCGPKPRGGKK